MRQSIGLRSILSNTGELSWVGWCIIRVVCPHRHDAPKPSLLVRHDEAEQIEIHSTLEIGELKFGSPRSAQSIDMSQATSFFVARQSIRIRRFGPLRRIAFLAIAIVALTSANSAGTIIHP